MLSKKTSKILGIVLSIVGAIATIINAITIYQISVGIWTPLDSQGKEAGTATNIIFLCIGIVLLIGGVICIVLSKKKK